MQCFLCSIDFLFKTVYNNHWLYLYIIHWLVSSGGMNMELIPDRLKTIREHLGINKAEAARLLNLTPMGYGRYENSERSPSYQMIEYMAHKMNTSAAYLTGQSDEQTPDILIFTKEDNQLLFQLATELKQADDSQLKRLLTYYHKMK